MTEEESALGTAVSCTGLLVSYCYASRLYNLRGTFSGHFDYSSHFQNSSSYTNSNK